MKRLITVIAIATIFALTLSAAPLSKELQKTQSWTASNKEDGVQLRAYDEDGELDFTLDGRVRIRLNALDLSLMIMADQKTYIFAVDTWMSDNGHYAVRTRDGHTILFVDWAEVNDSKTRRNVQTFDLYN